MSGLVLSVIWQTLRYRSRDPDVRAAVRWVAVALGGVLVVIVPLVMSVRLGGYGDPRWQAASVGLAVLGFYLVIWQWRQPLCVTACGTSTSWSTVWSSTAD